jgi:murein DD-endopeptidase MepM/ murein hydrolase activator NlpD
MILQPILIRQRVGRDAPFMSEKFLTLMIIPHNESHIREFNVSRPHLWGICAALTLCLCALIFYTVGYYVKQHREGQFFVLQTENAELKKQFERVQESLGELRYTVDDLTDTDRMMRAWTSLSEPGQEVRQMGAGGGSDEPPDWEGRVSFETVELFSETYANMDQLLRETRFLETSFDSMVAILSRNERIRNHTPSISPVRGQSWLSSGFGYRPDPFTGQRQFHNGLDIAGRSGTEIVATANGMVARVGKDKQLGFYVAIDHQIGYRTVYGHLKSWPTVKKGQEIKRGEVVGKMGRSGRATATHVHYSVVQNKRAANPAFYIFDQKNQTAIF